MATSHSKRSPAFQFYPRDFLSSPKVARMSMTERGIYITLLSHCWIDRGLPTEIAELAFLCEMKVAQFERIWTRGVLSRCFELRGERLVNPRLEVERKIQAEFSRKQQKKAEKRWGANAAAMPAPESDGSGNAPIPSHPIPSHPDPEEKESDETLRDSSPAVMTFPTVGMRSTWVLTQGRLDGWAHETYPNVDVLAECRKALAWIEANPKRRKTAKGMPSFLVSWLNRAVDRGGASASSFGGNPKTAGNAEVFRRFIERGRTA